MTKVYYKMDAPRMTLLKSARVFAPSTTPDKMHVFGEIASRTFVQSSYHLNQNSFKCNRSRVFFCNLFVGFTHILLVVLSK